MIVSIQTEKIAMLVKRYEFAVSLQQEYKVDL